MSAEATADQSRWRRLIPIVFVTYSLAYLDRTNFGIATASGMAALFAVLMCQLKSGDHVLCCNSVFGATHTVLEKQLSKFGITHSYVDINKTKEWDKAVKPNTKIIFVETPSNPGIDLVDLEWLGKFSKKHKTILIVNCPIL